MSPGSEYVVKVILEATNINGVTKQFTQLVPAIDNTGKATEKSNRSMSGLVGTALKSIPIWYALRTAYSAAITAFSEGVQFIVDADTAFRQALSVSSNQTLEFQSALKQVARTMSVETGVAITDVYLAYRSLATAGIQAETAVQAINPVLKLSVALFGDVEDTAKAVADMYNLFGDTIDDSLTPMQKFQEIAGTMVLLENENVYTLKQFTDSIRRFGGVAASSGISFKELAALVAATNTLMQRGETGGTSLARAFQNIVIESDRLNKFLKDYGTRTKDVNFSQESMIDIFNETIEVLHRFETGGDKTGIVLELFGQKATAAVSNLSNVIEIYKRNMDKLNTISFEENVKNLEERFQMQQKSIKNQIVIFKTLQGVMFEAFVTGVTNTDDFSAAMVVLNEVLKDSIPVIVTTSVVIRALANDLSFLFGAAINPQQQVKELNEKILFFTKQILEYRDITKAITAYKVKYPAKASLLDIGSLLDEANKRNEAIFGKDGGLGDLDVRVKDALSKLNADEKAGKIAADAGITAGKKYGDAFQDGFQSSLKKLFKGEEVDFFGDMKELFKDQIAEAMSQGVSKGLSGMFEDIGGVFGDVENIFKTPAENMYSSIVEASRTGADEFRKAIIEGAQQAANTNAATSAAGFSGMYTPGTGAPGSPLFGTGVAGPMSGLTRPGVGGATGSFFGKLGGGFNSFLSNSGGGKQLLARGITAYGLGSALGGMTGGGTISGLGGSLLSMGGLTGLGAVLQGGYSGIAAGGGLMGGISGANQFASAAGVGGLGMTPFLGALGGGLNLYQGIKSGNNMQTIGGGLMAGGSLLSMTGIGAFIGVPMMIAGSIMSLFGGGKKKTSQTTVQEDTFKVASKIDITNKRLEMVNRDLRAIRQTFETYILKESAYFSENVVSEQFSIDSKRLAQ